jgi:hypothetical protein
MEPGREVFATGAPVTGCPSAEVIMSPANSYYNFRHLSELEKEAKGGYLEVKRLVGPRKARAGTVSLIVARL